jgi:hypothetical protein
MGIYPYKKYLLGYKVSAEKCVEWFNKVYDLNETKIDLENIEEVNNLDEEVVERIIRDFKGIKLYTECEGGFMKSKSDNMYIIFTESEKPISQIIEEIDRELDKRIQKNSLELEIELAEARVTYLKGLYERGEFSDNYSSQRQLRLFLDKIKREFKPSRTTIVDGIFGDSWEPDLEKLKKQKILETITNIPEETISRATDMYKQITTYEPAPTLEVYIESGVWTSY